MDRVSSPEKADCRIPKKNHIKKILDGRVFRFGVILRDVTIQFFEEDRWIFILRRSLVTFRSIYDFDEYWYSIMVLVPPV